MATQKKNDNNNLVIATMANGKRFLCVEGEGKLINTMELIGGIGVGRGVFNDYLIRRNRNKLTTKKLSAVTDFTIDELEDEAVALWAHIQGMFKMAQENAKTINENNVFMAHYAGK